jgi:DNA-binding CsgD family transcriptional regulator
MTLSEADVRAMVRLLGEVAALKGGHTEKKRALMEGLCDLIDADSWVWCLCVDLVPGERLTTVSFQKGGLTDEQFGEFFKAVSHPDEQKLFAPFAEELARQGTHTTRLRQQTDPGDNFATSASRQLWLKAGVYPGILSARPLDERSISLLGIYRQPGRPDLSERESRIAHIVLSEVPWLHEQGWPEDRGVTVPRLAPRARIALNLLLQSQSRKQIADHMGLSIHTVSGYIKEIYRHFGVRSHAELMRHFLVGDGGDVPPQ